MPNPLDYQRITAPPQPITGSVLATVFGILSTPAAFIINMLLAFGASLIPDALLKSYTWTLAWLVFFPPLLALFFCIQTSRRLQNNITGTNALLLPIAAFAAMLGLITSTCMLMFALSSY
ncbi:MAG: hypothetical protein ACTHN5_09835 [Phycisphaerae bacterium]